MSSGSVGVELRAMGLVALGGFAGATGRHAVALILPGGDPWATLAVNVTGAFALGVVVYAALFRRGFPEAARLAVSTGFLSSFTTYSTLVNHAIELASPAGAAYVLGTYASGFGAVLLARAVVAWRS